MGAVFVFDRAGTSWTQAQAIPSPEPSVGAIFGVSLVVQGDTAIVGANGDASSGAYVYALSGGTWTLQQALSEGMGGDAGPTDDFGGAVALDGDTAIVGAVDSAGATGAAYVFVRSGSTWSVQQVLTAADGVPGDLFGAAVAVNGDTALVGAQTHAGTGAAYLFTRSGTTWTQAQELLPDPGESAFGQTLALTATSAIVTGGFADSGMYVVSAFPTSGAGSPVEQMLAIPDTMQFTPPPLTIATDGTTVVAGTPPGVSGPGEVFVFTLASESGDPCTSGDTCDSGFCVDGVCCVTATCPAAGTCNAAETCQPGTGTCSASPLNQGMPCDAGPCTSSATCQDGVCSGSIDVCAPADECHDFGSCYSATSTCFNPAMADGEPCTGGTCQGGVCVADQAAAPAAATRPAAAGARWAARRPAGPSSRGSGSCSSRGSAGEADPDEVQHAARLGAAATLSGVNGRSHRVARV